jgi:putative intracellular protease/amidase
MTTYVNPMRVLVLLSENTQLQLQGGKTIRTGTFLSEMMRPLMKLEDHGYEIHFATPKGNQPDIDPISDSFVWFGFNPWEYQRAKECLLKYMFMASDEMKGRSFLSPHALSSMSDQTMGSFAGLFIPGGHAPMIDLYSSAEVSKLIRFFHSKGLPIGAICHGPAALLATQERGGTWPFFGYNMTCYSDTEESINEFLWGDKMTFKAETALIQAGGLVTVRWPMMCNVIVDRELVTGQGPTSASEFAEKLVAKLAERRSAK